MLRLSFAAVVLASLGFSASAAAAQGLTCDPASLNGDSYRLTTDAQALNVTRPRTDWWDGFDATLWTHQDALADLNEAALALADRALALDPSNQLALSQAARQLVILGEDGQRARRDIDRLFAAGGRLAWTATLYDVDAKSFFVMTFGRDGIHVYRFGEAAPSFTRRLGVPEFPGPDAHALWRAWGGCVEGLRAEAFVPWDDVREIAAGNHVLWFRFDTPVTVSSDRGKRKRLDQFKVALHGAMGSVDYRVTPGDEWWDPPSVTGIGIGPSSYQDRVRRVLVSAVDPGGRIRLPKQKRGAGW
ncbi:MAG: hypothetical protein AB7H93_09120 [Vicinamibacterales bacterium]